MLLYTAHRVSIISFFIELNELCKYDICYFFMIVWLLYLVRIEIDQRSMENDMF